MQLNTAQKNSRILTPNISVVESFFLCHVFQFIICFLFLGNL